MLVSSLVLVACLLLASSPAATALSLLPTVPPQAPNFQCNFTVAGVVYDFDALNQDTDVPGHGFTVNVCRPLASHTSTQCILGKPLRASTPNTGVAMAMTRPTTGTPTTGGFVLNFTDGTSCSSRTPPRKRSTGFVMECGTEPGKLLFLSPTNPKSPRTLLACTSDWEQLARAKQDVECGDIVASGCVVQRRTEKCRTGGAARVIEGCPDDGRAEGRVGAGGQQQAHNGHVVPRDRPVERRVAVVCSPIHRRTSVQQQRDTRLVPVPSGRMQRRLAVRVGRVPASAPCQELACAVRVAAAHGQPERCPWRRLSVVCAQGS